MTRIIRALRAVCGTCSKGDHANCHDRKCSCCGGHR